MQAILSSWFVQGMIKATSDMWLKGWDERNGGNVSLRLDAKDVTPYESDFYPTPRGAVTGNARAGALLVYRDRFRQVLPQRAASSGGYAGIIAGG